MHPGCGKSGLGKTKLCIAHGGGKRCSHEGCEKSAQGGTGMCKGHGGRRRPIPIRPVEVVKDPLRPSTLESLVDEHLKRNRMGVEEGALKRPRIMLPSDMPQMPQMPPGGIAAGLPSASETEALAAQLGLVTNAAQRIARESESRPAPPPVKMKSQHSGGGAQRQSTNTSNDETPVEVLGITFHVPNNWVPGMTVQVQVQPPGWPAQVVKVTLPPDSVPGQVVTIKAKVV